MTPVLDDTMPFPSYLSNFSTPSHHNAYRRVLADETVDFSTGQSAGEIAVEAASLFLPTKEDSGLVVASGSAPVKLNFLGDAHAGQDLDAEFARIAEGQGAYHNLVGDEERGRAVLKAIADAIFPALNSGNLARTEMARAAAMEIAVAIANPRNLTIGARAVREAVNGPDNAVGCKLGRPKWGIDIHAYKNRITLCESNAWSRYHLTPPGDAPSKGAGKRAEAGAKASQPGARNVFWQDGKVLVADVCTTFTAKTGEWWLTRKVLPNRAQRATVGARIEMLHVRSPDKTLHRALAYENGTKRHALSNFLAWLCRFLRGVAISKVSKADFERNVLPRQAHRTGEVVALDGNEDKAHAIVDECKVAQIKRAELVDEDARRIGRRSGTWSDRARYHGKVDLCVSFSPGESGKPAKQSVTWVRGEAKRLPAYAVFQKAGEPRPSGSSGGANGAPSGSRAHPEPSAPEMDTAS